MKNIKKFHLKMNSFTAVKYCCILHGRVCVMKRSIFLKIQMQAITINDVKNVKNDLKNCISLLNVAYLG